MVAILGIHQLYDAQDMKMMLRTITSLDKRRLLPYALKKGTGNELASKELLSEFQEHAVLVVILYSICFFRRKHTQSILGYESPVSAHNQYL